MGNYSAGQIGENTLQAIEIVAQSVVDKAETTVTRDCVVSEIVDATSGLYNVSTGYSTFAAYSLNQTQYAIGDLVYVQMPAGSGTGDKLILGRRQSGTDAYEFADAFADTVFFNGRDNSLIKLTSPVGLIANGDTTSIHLGTWTGEYAGVTKIGIEGSFNTLLKVLGAVEGVYGLKMRTVNNVGNVEEFDFPCSEYYGNPYNYIYSTRVNQLFTYTTQQTLVQIDAYVYQNQDFRDDDEILIAVAQSANIILNDLYIGVGKLGSEILDSKLAITPYNGSRVYLEGGDATLITTFDTFVDKIGIASLAGQGSEAIWAAINKAETYEVLNEGATEDATPIQFTSTQITRINQWIESAEIVAAIDAGTLEADSMRSQGHNSVLVKLSVETPLITFSLVVNTEKTPEYLTATPGFADATNKNQFIRWFKQNREAEINNLTIPSELQSGWELIGGFEKEGTVSDEGYLIFTPDYTKDSETLVALIYYKEKYYVSNELVMINQVDATDKKIDDTKSELIDQAAKDKELIEANQRAINSLIIESGYFDTDEGNVIRFKQNNGLFYYYTRSGVIRENDKSRAYGLRCYSGDSNTVIQSLTWTFPTTNTMIRQHEDGYYQEGTLNASGENQIYPRSLITIDRKYNPGKTNNIVVVTAQCSVTTNGVTREVTLENQIELLFGYYSCEGTEHTLSAYWTNANGEVVNCLKPKKEYTAHLILDGKEVTSPTWEDYRGGSVGWPLRPEIGQVYLFKGIVSIESNMSLGCWLGAKVSYNEDNIIEGMTQLTYQTDGTMHMRDGTSDADVSPQYRLELLLEDEATGNQQYADGIWWDPFTGGKLTDDQIANLSGPEKDTYTDADTGEKKVLEAGWSYDKDGNPNGYFSGPSNWSIAQYTKYGSLYKEYFMRTDSDLKDYATWSNKNSVSCDYFSLVYVPQPNDTALVRSVVELVPKADYLTSAADYVFAINAYTYTGKLLVTIPLRIYQSRYASIYIDKMAGSTGIVIDDTLNTIFSPRLLAGKYADNPDKTGNKVFTGVALGDFADPETEAAMQEAGIYGFSNGRQAYAFKEDGTGFIGLDGKSKIKFNQKGDIPLAIGDDVFTVNTDGDINLTGSVTGGSSTSGYQLNKDGTGYIISNKGYGIYFKPDYYPIYISNPAYKDYPQKAPFSVDRDGNVNLQGSNVNINTGNIIMTGTSGVSISNGNNNLVMDSNGLNITDGNSNLTINNGISISNGQNILNMDSNGVSLSNGLKYVQVDSEGITLNGNIKFTNSNMSEQYATKTYADTAAQDAADRVNIPEYELTADKILAELKRIDSQGLFYKQNGQLYIKATGLAAQYLESDVVDIHGALRARDWDLGFVSGRLGAGKGKDGEGKATYGVGMAADPLSPTQLGPNDIPVEYQDGTISAYLEGGYVFVTDSGARIGYYSSNKNHTALVVHEGTVTVQYFENGVLKTRSLLWQKSATS